MSIYDRDYMKEPSGKLYKNTNRPSWWKRVFFRIYLLLRPLFKGRKD